MHDLDRGTIVVTGGAGLIGSALVWELNRRGYHDVLVVDRLDTGEKWKHLVPLRFTDFLDADEFECRARDGQGFGPVAALFHLGACSATTETDAHYLIRNNFAYTKHVAAWAIERDIRFVYASSAATYGALEDDLSDDIDPDALRPLNMYAYSKLLFDRYARDRGFAADVCGLKYFNVFGPNEDHKGEMRSMVRKAYEQIVAGGSVRLFKSDRPEFADGHQRRDFIYVKDAVGLTIDLAQSDANGIVNVGSGTPHTWIELIEPIFHALDRPVRIEFAEMPERLRGKYQYSTCATTARLRQFVPHVTTRPLDRAVNDYVVNYLVPDRLLDPSDPS